MLSPNNNLLVASVFPQTPRNKELIALQYKFLNKTTYNFTHCACLNGQVDESPFIHSQIIRNFNTDHLSGLNTILNFYKQSNYKHCLILDSDCFPIKPWQDSLLKSLQDNNLSIAAAVRTENFSRVGHPLAVYFTESVRFSFDRIGDVIDEVRKDVRLDNKRFWPLLRTNKLNLHYMFGGIYGDMFFHIGAASRSETNHFIAQFYPEFTLDGQSIYNSVIKDPEAFIDMVRNPVLAHHSLAETTETQCL